MNDKIELDVVPAEGMDNWFTIVVADVPDKSWMQRYIGGGEIAHSRLHCIQRVSDACVEGTKEQMLSIAKAIRSKTTVRHKRCAVAFEFGYAYFWSPRNSQYQGEVDYDVALRLAEKLEKL